MAELIKLADDRVERFDHGTTAIHAVDPVVDAVRSYIPARSNLALLDVGGGNGTFLDAMLMAMPGDSFGTVVEMSKAMVEKNITSSRKFVVRANFLDWVVASGQAEKRFDVIFFNFVLHHFVGRQRNESIKLQTRALGAAKSILADGGLIVVYEIHYNGWFDGELPSKLIHALTSSTTLEPVVKQLGANTAGYGVCFHSENYWRSLFSENGLKVVHDHLIVHGSFAGLSPRIKQFLLNISTMDYKIHFLQAER
jgi:SAM-dependent methyltransferase